jgi:hypothetical protein
MVGAKLILSLLGSAIVGAGITTAIFVGTGNYHSLPEETATPMAVKPKPTPSPSATVSVLVNGGSATAAEQDVILRVARAYAVASGSAENVELNVVKNDGTFARVTGPGSAAGTGMTMILKKASGYWLVVFEGQGSPTAETTTRFAIPAAIVQ